MRIPFLPALALATLAACGGPGTTDPAATGPAAAPPASRPPTDTPPAPPAPPDPPPPALRLGDDVRPTHYDLDLSIDPEEPTYTGEIHIDLAFAHPTRFFWMHALDLTITDAGLGPDATHTTPVRTVTADGGFLGVALPAEQPAGPAVLVIHFSGQIDEQRSRGVYRVKEPDGHFYVYTFFEPVDARRAFPCFDEPGFKVPWKLTITAPPGSVAISNSPEINERATKRGVHTYLFDDTPALPSYLVAFVVGPFEVIDGGTAGHHATPLRFIIPQGRSAELRYALEITGRAVGLLEDWYGVPYPFAKLDVAVVPRYWGTMEHPGIVALGQPLTLIKPEEETLFRKQEYANIMVHELGHYWFGDLVTMAWWNETWLNEGMTEWMDRQVTAQVDPSWKFDREAWRRSASAMGADSLVSAKALRQPIDTATDVETAFDGALTYFKGDAVLSMFQAWVGVDVFHKGLRRYLDDHARGNVTTEDLLAALDAESGRDMSTAMKTFIDQPGVPEVTVHLQCAKGAAPTVHLTQKRYRPLGQDFDDATPLWGIPVCLRWSVGGKLADKCELVSTREADIALDAKRCPDWLDGNAGGVGYYHVRYDDAAAKALLAHAKQLQPVERFGLLVDLGAEVASGELDIGVALAAAPTFLADAEAPVTRRAFGLLGLIQPAQLPAELRPAYRRMVKKLTAPLAKRLGWAPRKDESVDDHDLRVGALGQMLYGAEDPAYAKKAHELALAWIADRKAVDPDLAGLVLHGAAYFGDAALFDAFLAEAQKSTDREDRAMLYGALGAFRVPALLDRALALTIDPQADMRDVSGVLCGAFGASDNREQAWGFLKAHFDELAARMRDDEKADLLNPLDGFCRADLAQAGMPREAASFCDAEHREDEATSLTSRAAAIDGGPATLARALSAIDVCIVQRDRFASGIAAFLKKF